MSLATTNLCKAIEIKIIREFADVAWRVGRHQNSEARSRSRARKRLKCEAFSIPRVIAFVYKRLPIVVPTNRIHHEPDISEFGLFDTEAGAECCAGS